ncbi:excalibur calcium-binding domain-containing protein [Nocardia sp. CA-119907]|uniref:excalibur calcium-binding domain-containing protein n=1 Tax=Nocardia sp. CA-119907 TaxID=3239973 RepID=UPI003D96915C
MPERNHPATVHGTTTRVGVSGRPPGEQRASGGSHRSRRAAKAPPHRGDPGYASHLDRDNDGIACE